MALMLGWALMPGLFILTLKRLGVWRLFGRDYVFQAVLWSPPLSVIIIGGVVWFGPGYLAWTAGLDTALLTADALVSRRKKEKR